jgi:hypothetical protein
VNGGAHAHTYDAFQIIIHTFYFLFFAKLTSTVKFLFLMLACVCAYVCRRILRQENFAQN